jgi:metallo-beta-lactamase class B
MRTITILILCLPFCAAAGDSATRTIVSANLEIIPLSRHVYMHVSYSEMPPCGRVASNGLIYTVGNEALLFDTPPSDSLTRDLVQWITDSLQVRIVGFVPNHWHNDCMGGLNTIHSSGIPSYAHEQTIKIALSRNLPVPQLGFTDSLFLYLGEYQVVCRYFGPAHTSDNIITWIPAENVLFTGCMVKELAAKSPGNLADADTGEWPHTIKKVIDAFPGVLIVVPGHGKYGGRELLQHTRELLLQTK